ncbi:HD domain-containing protein [Lipomyces orientalis]|uniref:HD domain-containing protein n=1 Tax=Lipomyces orientalis TaxID=1233043 RepID=A0ACC3TNW1_9ASCO
MISSTNPLSGSSAAFSNGITDPDGKISTWTPEAVIPPEILKLPAPLSFFRILRYLKVQRRTGWLNHGIRVESAESIADHMYRMAVMCLLAPSEEKLDSRKCAMIALVHDLAEAVVGDLTPLDPVGGDEKHRRERETIFYLANQLKLVNPAAAAELTTCYFEYEEQTTPEGRFVKDLDKFEFLLQTAEYEMDIKAGIESEDVDIRGFWYARNKITHPLVKEWTNQLIDERTQALKEELHN